MKEHLFNRGRARVLDWCALNALAAPAVMAWPAERWRVNACAYYRGGTIHICLARCAPAGGARYSWPGYAVDRTPYGVLAHELEHHVDVLRSAVKGAYYGNYSVACGASAEKLPSRGTAPTTGSGSPRCSGSS